jgi:small subunit ribosomal protein S1
MAFGGSSGIDAEQLMLAMRSGTPVEGEFKAAVKAGLEVDIGGIRAFCPASQADLTYVADLETFVGQRYFFKVLEVREGGRSVVVSRKALLQEERQRQASELLSRLEVGAELDGIVQTLQPYGAFVDLGGVQGLVHVSEISHARIGSPSDALSVGESVRVKILAIENPPSGGGPRVSLSMKALIQGQPEAAAANDKLGEVIKATVNKVENFGLVVDTPAGSGLVPNGELDLPANSDPRRAFKPGDAIDVVLLRREPSGKLRFSAKSVREVEEKQAYRSFAQEQRKARGGTDALGSMAELLRGLSMPELPNRPPQPAPAPAKAEAPSADAAKPNASKGNSTNPPQPGASKPPQTVSTNIEPSTRSVQTANAGATALGSRPSAGTSTNQPAATSPAGALPRPGTARSPADASPLSGAAKPAARSPADASPLSGAAKSAAGQPAAGQPAKSSSGPASASELASAGAAPRTPTRRVIASDRRPSNKRGGGAR